MSKSDEIELFEELVKVVKKLIDADNSLIKSIMKYSAETVFTDIIAKIQSAIVLMTDADENDEDGFDSETLFNELSLDNYYTEYIINKWKNHLK